MNVSRFLHPRDRSPSEKHSGFSLLEILVALTVISLVAMAAVKASSQAVENGTYLKERTLAHWVAMNRAAELQLAETWLPLSTATGEEVMAGRPWPWQTRGQQTPDPDLRRAEIKVWGGDREAEPLASLVVYIERR